MKTLIAIPFQVCSNAQNVLKYAMITRNANGTKKIKTMKNRYKMNTIKTLTRYAFYTLLVAVLFSCKNEPKQNSKELEKNSKELETYLSKGKYESIEIVKVRNCEYVLWHNGYGSDMEHYEGCKNTEHCN